MVVEIVVAVYIDACVCSFVCYCCGHCKLWVVVDLIVIVVVVVIYVIGLIVLLCLFVRMIDVTVTVVVCVLHVCCDGC